MIFSVAMDTEHLALAITILLFLLNDVIVVSGKGRIVQTDKGLVRGFTTSPLGKKVDVFLGIPFARPPLGKLRFKPPVQLDPWTGVYNATRMPNSCIQGMDNYFGNFTGSTMWNANTKRTEDCLYLNVWTPHTNPPYSKKAVLVWVYGGGFYSGSSTLDIYNGDILAAENDVVVVSMQYRVGALGFLTLDTDEAPGNAGLWDQRMAMEWVSRNIHFFGGDAHNVTLVGESAGAVSVGFHLLCNFCRGYFHKAILQSGGPEAKWGALPKEDMWWRSEALAKDFGCYGDGSHAAIVHCLRQIDADEFPHKDMFISQGIVQFSFVPTIDGVFLQRAPSELIRDGMFKKIPLLLGSNTNEATFFLIYQNDQFKLDTDSLISRKDYNQLMSELFEFYPHFPYKLNNFGKEAIKFHYTNWLNPNDKLAFRQSIDSAISDFHFVCTVNRLARAYAHADLPVYYYWFDHRWPNNPWPEWMGVLHADELWFTFGRALDDKNSFSDDEKDLSRLMMRYWTNFAKTGNPNQYPGEEAFMEWPSFRADEQLYMNISTKTMNSGHMWGQAPRTQHCAFWDYYLPKLVSETSDITEAEREWKVQFNEWKNRYIVDWKAQFDNFLHNYQKRMGSCGGNRP